MGIEFGSFNGICETAALVICPLVGTSQGIEPTCYSRNVDIAGTLIFQPCECHILQSLQGRGYKRCLCAAGWGGVIWRFLGRRACALLLDGCWLYSGDVPIGCRASSYRHSLFFYLRILSNKFVTSLSCAISSDMFRAHCRHNNDRHNDIPHP
jgi:hypothetical protein